MTRRSDVDVVIKPSLDQVKSRLAKARKDLADLHTPLKKVSIMLDRWVQDNFKTEGGKVGGWAPFKHGGRVTFKGTDESAKLLQDTGRLRNSFVPFVRKNDAGIGSDVPYSKKHNQGIGVVQRRILPKVNEIKKPVSEIFNRHVKEIANRRYT